MVESPACGPSEIPRWDRCSYLANRGSACSLLVLELLGLYVSLPMCPGWPLLGWVSLSVSSPGGLYL